MKFIVERKISIFLVQSCMVLSLDNPETRAENQQGIDCTDRTRNLVDWYAVSHSKKTCSGLMKTGLNNFLMKLNSIEQCC